MIDYQKFQKSLQHLEAQFANWQSAKGRPEHRLVAELKDALDESNLPFIVDLHVWDELPESFHQMIRENYAVLQQAVPSADRLEAAGYGV